MKKRVKQIFIAFGLVACITFQPVYGRVLTKAEEKLKEESGEPINSARDLSIAFRQVAKKAIPAVVYIRAENSSSYAGEKQEEYDLFSDDFFNRFFGPRFKSPSKPQISQGSGFFVSSKGHIMTNYHVVKDATKITVGIQNGDQKEMQAELIGGDSYTDVAVIKVSGEDFPYLDFGNSDEVEIGDWAIAVGNPFQLEASLTVGIISAKGRNNLQITDLEDFIQTDAAINPGNSGGPLLDLNAQVIGMNTAIVSKSGGYMGIGFAIPSNILSTIKSQLIEKGEVTRGFLGVSLQPIDKDLAESFNLEKTEGALVAEVVKGSPADKAGLKQGDIILEIDGHPIRSPSSLKNDVLLKEPGKKITLSVKRKNKIVKIPVTLGSHSETTGAAVSGLSQKLGLDVENLTPELAKKHGYSSDDQGVLVRNVKPGTISYLAGIRPGSLIIAVNHQKISNTSEYKEVLEGSSDQKRVLILINYKGQMRFYSLKLPE
ncbi:MAG: DegQ family serine endoprotease [Simkaniaceae bacterium]